ncbi:hypothetical protein N0V90_011026 [Kalmusia sp. IMI 367209]|nr:hypothetical protein N0V90_011026 [Kalmusia sp. IMI 367209]
MDLTARLERLRVLVQDDLAALPERPASPDLSEDEGATGGVALDESPSVPLDPSKQTDSSSAKGLEQSTKKESISETNAAIVAHENTDRRYVWIQGTESSYNLGSKPKLSALPTSPLAPTDLQRAQLAPSYAKYFTPIVALSKYPYKFCSKNLMQDIASAFFDQGKFWAREWDLYYLWDIDESRPLILVRESQFEDLLKEINSGLKLELKITNQQREEGLVSRFPDHPRCQPRYLGRSHSRDEYETMVDQVPNAGVRAPGEPSPPLLDGQTLEDFKQMIQESWEVQKAKSKASKEKKKVERLARQKVFADQFKRAQRYLGLRPNLTEQPAPGPLPAVDCSLPVPFPFDRSVVFVCVDVEAWERDHHKITEVGVATLDTRDLVDFAPLTDGQDWRSKIRARHFRITEHAHLVNSDFVSGCPDHFYFGQSEFVSLRDAPAMVAACFKPPFCARPGQVPKLAVIDSDEQRNIIFLGHDTLGDVKYLQKLGFDPLSLPNLLEAQDSANLYRVWHRDEQITKLGYILNDFDIAGFSLHNAGNDAVYTVQAFLGICVREASIRNSPEMDEMRNEQKESRIALAQQELRQDIENDTKGWDATDADGDGGEPVPIVMKKEAAPKVIKKETAAEAAHQPDERGSTSSENVGGRGRGGDRSRGPVELSPRAHRGGRGGFNNEDLHQTPDNFNNRSGRGDAQFRSTGRGRGRGYGRGRGRGRGSPVPGTYLRWVDGGSTVSEPEVCGDLIDLSTSPASV